MIRIIIEVECGSKNPNAMEIRVLHDEIKAAPSEREVGDDVYELLKKYMDVKRDKSKPYKIAESDWKDMRKHR